MHFFERMDFGKFRSFRGISNADMEDGDMRKLSRATSTPQYYNTTQYYNICRAVIIWQPYGSHNIYMSVYGYAMDRASTDAPRRPFISFVGTTVFATIPPVRCRKSARFFQKLPFRTGGAGEKTRFLLKKSAGIRPKSAVTHWKSALENI